MESHGSVSVVGYPRGQSISANVRVSFYGIGIVCPADMNLMSAVFVAGAIRKSVLDAQHAVLFK
jgi:hypothetical protein